MTIYLIQVSVALILFYWLFTLFLKNETNFKLSRFFLLFALLASLMVPLINSERIVSNFIQDTEVVYEYWLPDLSFNNSQVQNNESPNVLWNFIVILYLVGVILSLSRILISYYNLAKIKMRAKLKHDGVGWYYVLDGDKGSFSFFNNIFIGNKSWHSEEDKESILAHERSHAKQLHSIDVMLIQLIGVLVWFNPIIYWYRNTLEQIHEYEADSIASQNKSEDYCGLLVKDSLDTIQFSIVNHFNKSLTLKRINMIQSLKRKMSNRKKIGLIAAVMSILVAMACEDKVLTDMKRAAGQSVLLTEYPKDVKEAVDKLKSKNPNADIQVYGVVKTQDLERIELNGKTATMFFRDGDPDYKVYVILGADDIQRASQNLLEVREGQKVYTIVQEPASPVGGMENFYDFVGQNLKYPEQARRMGVEGRVFVKFMVDENGKLSNFQIIRGIGAGCDAEAIRVLSQASNWNPGKQDGKAVKSFFNLAIIFKLDSNTKQTPENN